MALANHDLASAANMRTRPIAGEIEDASERNMAARQRT
jgi:hypothetical protein